MNVRLLILIMGTIIFASCEKRDVLGDQGDLTGKDYPYLTLASIPDSRPMDTAGIVASFWAVDDDISHLRIAQRGYKVNDIYLKWKLEYTVDSLNISNEVAFSQQDDTLFYPETVLIDIENQGNALDTFYQTLESSYVVNKEWVIPEEYSLTNQEGEEALEALESSVLDAVRDYFADQLNARDVQYIFPVADSSFFEVDEMGDFTGNLTEAGRDSVYSWTSLEVLKAHLESAEVNETAEVTISAEVANQKEITVKDESTFEILN